MRLALHIVGGIGILAALLLYPIWISLPSNYETKRVLAQEIESGSVPRESGDRLQAALSADTARVEAMKAGRDDQQFVTVVVVGILSVFCIVAGRRLGGRTLQSATTEPNAVSDAERRR